MKQTKLTLTAMVIALCAIGAVIKIPAFITTAALDAAPALISVVFLPPMLAGVAGALGHILTALTSGMPLGPLHVIIAIEMLIVVSIFAILHQKNYHLLKWIWLLVGNGVLSALPFYFIISPAFFIASVPGLLIATVINGILAAVLIPIIQKVVMRKEVHG